MLAPELMCLVRARVEASSQAGRGSWLDVGEKQTSVHVCSGTLEAGGGKTCLWLFPRSDNTWNAC